MPEQPSTAVAVKPEDTKWGIGFKLRIGTHTLELKPGDVGSSDLVKKGTFRVQLPPDDKRDIGSFKEFWNEVSTAVVDLPPLEDYELPDPLDDLIEADVILREFDLHVVEKKLQHFVIDVELKTDWAVPGLKQVEIETLRVRIEHTPTAVPAG